MSDQLHEYSFELNRSHREQLLGQRAHVIWLTGLSGSGKSTIADHLAKVLTDQGKLAKILDGDTVRKGLNSDLDFTREGRSENLRRVAEVARILLDTGVIVIASFISPLEEQRKTIQGIVGENDISICYVDCPIEVCEERDTKGLYAKARSGEIEHFTGVSSVYETPVSPEVHVHSDSSTPEESVELILSYLSRLSLI